MVLIQLNLSKKESKMLDLYKIKHNLKDKKIALKKVIRENLGFLLNGRKKE